MQAAAVLWQDGTLTQAQVEQGWFMLVRLEPQPACQLQLLDKTKTVTRTIDLTQLDFTSTDATTPLPSCVDAVDA